MKFLQPQYLHVAWLALAVLALHLFRRRAQAREVSSLLFFRWLAREHQESAWLRQLKKWLALLVSLLVVAAAALALARPVAGGSASSGQAVVVLVDCSASMAALDEKGESRLQAAQRQLRQRLQALPETVPVSLIAHDRAAQGLLARSSNRRECLRLLSNLKPQPMEGKPAAAMRLVRPLMAMDPQAELWHASDQALGKEDVVATVFVDVALAKPMNVGITAFEIRRAPLSLWRHDVFVAVQAASSNARPAEVELEMTLGGSLAQLRRLELSPGATEFVSLPLERPRGEWLEVRLRAQGDVLWLDDAVGAPCPQPRLLSLLHVAEQADPFTQLALQSLAAQGQLQVISIKPAQWAEAPQADVLVLERWLPKVLPADRPCLLLEPPQSAAGFEARSLPAGGLLQDSVTDTGLDHPVVHRLRPSELSLRQSVELLPNAALQPLWVSRQQTLLAAGQWQGQRLVVTAFSPSGSQRLTLMPAFPLLLGNAVEWCAQEVLDAVALPATRAGETVTANGLVQWKTWDGRRFVDGQTQAQSVMRLDRLGYWQQGGARGLSLLASSAETQLPSLAAQGKGPAGPSFSAALGAEGLADLPRKLLWLLLLIWVLESWLFHRHALY